MIYVIKHDNPAHPTDFGMPTRVRLIGPFDSEEAAAGWGQDPRNNPYDNPWWHVVDLADPVIPVVAP